MIFFDNTNLDKGQHGWDYQFFRDGAVPVFGMPEPVIVDLVPVESNSRQCWQGITPKKQDCMCRIYEVDLSKTEVTDTFIENLQYFLIRADRVKDMGQKNPQLGLLIHGRKKDIFRIRTFFSMFSGENARYNFLYRITDITDKESGYYNVCFPSNPAVYHNENTMNPSRLMPLLPGRLMPLLHVVAPDVKQFSGDVSLADLLSTEETGASSMGTKLSAEELKTCLQVYPEEKNVPWWMSVQKLCLLYWNRILHNLTGDGNKKITAGRKQVLQEQLIDFVLRKRQHMCLLAELCWFYHLYAATMDKSVLLLVDNQWELNTSTLLQSYLDTINYTDGILQLLENSCQHTCQRAAYLGMRLLFVDRHTTDIQLITNMRTRETLMNRYEALSGLPWSLERKAKYYMDISIIDDARAGKELNGLLKIYRDNARKRYGLSEDKLPQTLEDVFSDKNSLVTTVEGIVHHYGLDALKQVISKNQGIFLVSSPYTEVNPSIDTTEVVLYPIPEKLEMRPKLREGLDETTEYHVLYPLGLHSLKRGETTPNQETEQVQNRLFETDDLTNWNIETRKLFLPDVFCSEEVLSLYLSQDDKIKIVSEAVEEFQRQILEEFEGSTELAEIAIRDRIYLFDIRKINSLQMELFAKFLFQLIANNRRKGERQLFAVYFDDPLKQQELIRLFAIFYKRARQQQKRKQFQGTQIALCSTHPTLKIPEVNLVLNAKNWNSLMKSAQQFAYCNLESAQNVYSQIRYFADMTDLSCDGVANDTSQFPFDLFLKEDMGIHDEADSPLITVAENSQCWFLQRIARSMEADLQRKQFGIRIPDAHFYLSSNIHLESFYLAEQLFHNIAYVWRFAYLLSRRLLASGYHHKKYFLVCYEAYSSLLVQYLAEYIKLGRPETESVEYAILYQDDRDDAHLLMPECLTKEDCQDVGSDWGFVCLYPIGTTLSTIHSMHECIEKELGINIACDNMRDMVMILVAADDESKELQLRYWHTNYHKDMAASSQQKAQVQLHRRYDDTEWSVGFFIIARTTWHDPFYCAETDRSRPLVHTDITSTELNMIFPPQEPLSSFEDISKRKMWELIHQHDVCSFVPFGERINNDKRLSLMRTCIHYGHVVDGNNHYSFYINFPRYFEALKRNNGSGYEEWLKGLRGKMVCPEAFNIIVTPLRTGRSPLLKDLMDSVFAHCAHILQLDLHNSRRTDVRTRYSFIGHECAELLRNNPSAQINVYYVDDSIVTAETLQRGLSLIQMLLRDCIPLEKEIHLYKGIFVLVNRSSRDTIQSFVDNPSQDYHAFVHLAIPHYNTRNGHCPACKRVEKYKMLANRSSTNAFVEEYQRLSDKEQKRIPEEFENWQRKQLWESPSAFLHLRQWIYYNSGNRTEKNVIRTKEHLHELQTRFFKQFCYETETPEEDMLLILSGVRAHTNFKTDELRQVFLTMLEQLRLCDIQTHEERSDKELLHALEWVWFNCVLGDRVYRRLMSTHHAYGGIVLEKEPAAPDENNAVAVNKMKTMILDYIKQEMTSVEGRHSAVECWEQLHSCLKVVSRDNLARHHLVREAIFDILHEAADLMLGINHDNSELRKLFSVEKATIGVPFLHNTKCKEINPLLRYQMFGSIIRRLSDMQSNYPILKLSENLIPQQFENLLEVFFRRNIETPELDEWFFCSIPSRERMLFSYEKCVKLATMADDEKNKSMLIQKKWKHTP